MIEPCVAIILACLPIIRTMLGQRFSSKDSSNSAQSGSDGSVATTLGSNDAESTLKRPNHGSQKSTGSAETEVSTSTCCTCQKDEEKGMAGFDFRQGGDSRANSPSERSDGRYATPTGWRVR